MKKTAIALIIVSVIILTIITLSYVFYLIEVRTLQDTAEKFIRAVQSKDKNVLEKISGGRIFVNLFSGDESSREYYLEEIVNKFPNDAEIRFLKSYRSTEFSQDERRRYGSMSWKINILVISHSRQHIGGYIFYISKLEDTVKENGSYAYKVIDISNVGEISF